MKKAKLGSDDAEVAEAARAALAPGEEGEEDEEENPLFPIVAQGHATVPEGDDVIPGWIHSAYALSP